MGHIEQLKPPKSTYSVDLDFKNLINAGRYLETIVKELGPDKNKFKGLKCLDICCGSNATNSDGFYPWLALLLANQGVEVTGIDIGSQPIELSGKYKHLEFDLLDLDKIGFSQIPEIGNSKFGLITCLYTITPFVSSPVLIEKVRKQGRDLREIQTRILAEIDTHLEPDGIAIIDTLDGWQQITRKKSL